MLANDSDPDPDDSITLIRHTQPRGGEVSCEVGTCTYTPAAGLVRTDGFTYTIADEWGLTDTATVTVAVGVPVPDNLPPQAVPDQATTEVGRAERVDVLANDGDPDPGDTLTVTGGTDPENGAVECDETACTYTPDDGFVGTDAFEYTVSDGNEGEDSATVTVAVEGLDETDPTTLVLEPSSPPPGGTTVARGEGCEPGSDVTVTIDGTIAAGGAADARGAFAVRTVVGDLEVGRHTVVARCDPLILRAPLDVAVVSTAPATGMSTIAAILCFFVLLGLLVYQPPVPPRVIAPAT